MNKCIQKTEIPDWMTKVKIILIQKDSFKETASTQKKKTQTLNRAIDDMENASSIRKDIYISLIRHGIFSEEHKGYCKRTRGSGELLYIYIHTFPRRVKDFKKTYDMVLQREILHCLKMYKIPGQVVQFIKMSMEAWRVELTV